jgi:hypothetical protein
MVNLGRAGRHTRRMAARGVTFDIRIGLVVLEGVPAIGQSHLAAAIQTSLVQALTAGTPAPPIPTSRNVAVAAGDIVHLCGTSFASQVGDAMAPVLLDTPPGRTGHQRGDRP